ncbi:MAG: CoA pyrophosphatase [Chloroflexota bacterium]|nr:CoA pyrophosphatase [Chloroflexota bacterium]
MAGLINLVHVRRALALRDFDSRRARQVMSPVPRGWRKRESAPAQAAVMVLLYHDNQERLHVVLTLRQAGLRGHSGQVSFPGGRQDAQDRSLTDTAIRETGEEIGICRERIRVLGGMPGLYIPTSHHDVYPSVGYCETLPRFRPNPQEVAEIFSFALDDLLHPRFKREERRMIGGYDVWVPYYDVCGHKVWGATAIMLSELAERLRQVLPERVLLELR